MRRIESPSNPVVRALVREAGCETGPGRRRMLLEGPHLVQEGLASSRIRVSHLFVEEGEAQKGETAALLSHPALSSADVVLASPSVIRKLSSTSTPQGILAVADFELWRIQDIVEQKSGLVVVCDGIQDPGNLGVLIRTSASAGAGGVLLLAGSADPFNPKTLRSTAGSFFHLPVVRAAAYGELARLRDKGYRLLGAQAHGAASLFGTVFPERTVLVFGSEGQGLSSGARDACDGFFTIPVDGPAESLNVASAAAVSIYEYVRQRAAG